MFTPNSPFFNLKGGIYMEILNLSTPESIIKIGNSTIRYFQYQNQTLFVAKDLGDFLGYPVVDSALRKTVSKANLIPAHFKSATQGRGQNLINTNGVIELRRFSYH